MSLKCKNVKWNDRVLPPTFLQEMFTLQEELDEILENQDQQGLLQMRELLENRFQDLESGLLPLFRMLDSMEEPETVLEKLQMDLNAERYLRRLLERIKIEETTCAKPSSASTSVRPTAWQLWLMKTARKSSDPKKILV